MSDCNGYDMDMDEGGWNNSTQNLLTKTPIWREDPSVSLSDWKIVIQNEDHGSSIYYTHKYVLALGERRSEYFATQFSLPLETEEIKRAETVLTLTTLCAPFFPIFLDFVYEGTIVLSKENVVPLMELARRFGNAALGQQAEIWAKTNLKENVDDCALVMLSHSVELRMEKVMNASIWSLAPYFPSLSKDYLLTLPFEVVVDLIEISRKIVKDYRFTLCSKGMQCSDCEKWISNNTPETSQRFAIATPALSGPISYWKLEVISLKSVFGHFHSIFFGIIANNNPNDDSRSDPSSFGWSSQNVYSKGVHSLAASQVSMNIQQTRFRQGDIVIMKFDSIKKKLTMKHTRLQKSFHLNVDPPNSRINVNWYIHVNLCGANDSCMLHTADQKEFDKFQF